MSLESFISYLGLEKNYSPHTTKAYRNDILEFQDFCRQQFGIEDIAQISYNLIRSWIVSLVESGVSNRSVNRKIASLKAYYKYLLGAGVLTVNPLAKHKALKTSKKIEIPFSETEMDDVLSQIPFEDNFEGKRDKLIIELLYTTGIRRAELIGLKVGDVDYGAMTIKVLGKRNKERIIPLLEATKELFLEYNLERSALEAIKDKAYILLSAKGNKMYETLVYRIINKYFSLVSAKVKKSPHILRHTFATHLLNKGADLNSVKELLGHSSLASTQVYTHNSIAELKKVHLAAHPRSKK
ncbi:tyrosine-type recombinase/integrase [Arenibacter sp. M-2]|uniref:tyrosine-type recombinase/integrase n=1 Tax=unclassified Arenibacter TaxID=2615047 RepID=UPI000D766801|nr:MULTISPECIES: tyrosine-type recombinase/integrase [unclassified Arenibacter]MDL5510817.1 tyrosine-type recombinase/integrase [Arenibacter sp. M-2]PXX26885.1 integrase/recombinase XerC [Arenibacter sp. ARW7G5Y1]|tara:strand:- start:395 stop:1285 length:891 start_codon:yes stop_codon:yes gene_type:complete